MKEAFLAHHTIGIIMDDLGENIEVTLNEKLFAFVLYILALNKSTDQSDTAQLIIFIRRIDINFNIIEKLYTCVT